MKSHSRLFVLVVVSMILQACNLPLSASPTEAVTSPTEAPTAMIPTETASSPASVQHLTYPASASISTLSFDVDSSSTAPEQRAPYGDSYDINRLERPFLQDMSYVADLDIRNFSINKDADWYYISIKLVGTDPNNSLNINYGVEFDVDLDGFGDFIVIASPLFDTEWSTTTVSVHADKNHDTSGISSVKSDAPFNSDGYETLVFDGSSADNEDPDLAWVRINADNNATLQFAVKKSLVGESFMYGVLADGGFKDVSMLDYVDRFSEEDAGSPIRDKPFYPLKELYAVDNTCRAAYGFTETGYEPMICPKEPPPTPEPRNVTGSNPGCANPSSYGDQSSCEAAGCVWEQNPKVLVAVIYHCVAP